MDAPDRALCQALADVATIGLVQERAVREATQLAEQLQKALDSRVVIEQAKGVLAERSQIGLDRAFDRLRTYARAHSLLITQAARRVIDDGLTLEDPPTH
jgi:AmiR/NasT family two-component response regulator